MITQLLGLEERRRNAMLAGDVDALQALFAPDLQYAHSTGVVDSRDSLLSRLTSGDSVYQHLVFEKLVVTATEHAGIIAGEMHAELRKEDQLRKLNNRYLAVWLLRDGIWQFSAFQSAKLPEH